MFLFPTYIGIFDKNVFLINSYVFSEEKNISIVNKNIRFSDTHVFSGEINISIVKKNIRVSNTYVFMANPRHFIGFPTKSFIN